MLLPTNLGHCHQKSGKADHLRVDNKTADKYLPNKAMKSWPEKPSQSSQVDSSVLSSKDVLYAGKKTEAT